MVPFSFENIARSAGLDTPKAHPVSDAARATHESFASHLQSAVAPPRDQSTRPSAQDDKPPERSDSTSDDAVRNEPVSQDTGETSRDEADVHSTDIAEVKAAEKHSNDDDQRDAKPEDEAVVARVTEPPQATSQAVTLDAAGDVDAISNSVVEVSDASLGDEEPALDAS
ncbi:MAG: hypothetical protein ABI614_28625, partial [Planctomycetota bacterium]